MATTTEMTTLYGDDVFRKKVLMEVTKHAKYQTINDAAEFIIKKFAAHVLKNPAGSWFNTFVLTVLTDPSVTPDGYDTVLEQVINSSFEQQAKLFYANI